MTHLPDPGSITEAAGEAHGSEVPLENFGEKSPPRSLHGCTFSGMLLWWWEQESRDPRQEPGHSLRAVVQCEALPEKSFFPSLFTGVTPVQSGRIPPPPVPFPLIFHSISAIGHLHF